ncbi:MAG: metallophosphoesterase [Chloroflexi bacterium]|nr:metallophosphoesterase [Chloroflexota bacterium]
MLSASLEALIISDRVSDYLYDADAAARFPGVDVVISCGDLPYHYVEFVQDALRAPLYYVRGNHAQAVEYGAEVDRRGPQGGVDLHRRTACHLGLLMAGFEGSIRYRSGNYQYTQTEMWTFVLGLTPALLFNRIRYGRYLDVLVTHSPPWGVNDGADPAHQGFKAFRWLHRVFRPRFHFHGHMHVLGSRQSVESMFFKTQVINTYGYRRMTISTSERQTRLESL